MRKRILILLCIYWVMLWGYDQLMGLPKPARPQSPAAAHATTPTTTDATPAVPTETPGKTPADVPADAPVDVPADAPVDTPTDAPVDVPTDKPIDVPTDAPVDVPTDAPVDVPTDVPVDTPVDTPVDVPTQPEHLHTFGQWTLKQTASCCENGVEERICTGCQKAETRLTDTLPHALSAYKICNVCKYVAFDPDAKVAELGIFSNCYFTDNPTANYAWDVKIWGDWIYRGAGDYDKNSGSTPILAFNTKTRQWAMLGNTADEAVHRFVEIDGTLYTPGIDATEGWESGNFYVLEGETWKKVRNLPNGIHNFDMTEFDGKLFAGLGTQTVGNTVAVSQDKGKTWTFVPLYRDGKPFDTTGYAFSRTCTFAEYKGSLYALLLFKQNDVTSYDMFIFRYVDGKMVYQSVADSHLTNSTGRNYWQGNVEWKGICYLTATSLMAVTDFANPDSHRQIFMPRGEYVSDILLYNDELYVLSLAYKEDQTCRVAIYKTPSGEDSSFTEVVAFEYGAIPLAFDFDGEHFYIGTGSCPTDPSRSGMLLRVKA